MKTDVLGPASNQPAEPVVQPLIESITPAERRLLMFYRRLGADDQAFIGRAIEAMATCCDTA